MQVTARLLAATAFVQAIFWGGVSMAADTARPITWDFEHDQTGSPPAGFSFGRTGEGRLGRWVVVLDTSAPNGGHVLAQTDADPTDYRFPVAVADAPVVKDLRLSVRCKPVSGQGDQAAGLVFRYRDENNYYVTRANALENNIGLYHVVKGARRRIAGWNGAVTTGVWHELTVTARDTHVVVSWDGQVVIDVEDRTMREPGRVGVWTKADSVTYFDNLRVEPVDP